MNQVLLDAIKRGLGIEEQPVRRGNLDRYAGDSPSEFGPEWEERIKVFDQIDEELWR